jgi:release factor glutamine methyltransferase
VTTIGQIRRAIAKQFRDVGLDSPDLDARVLVGHALKLDQAGLASGADLPLSAADAETIQQLAARRLAREPVARIVGGKEFWGLRLQIGEATLVPRPETETVVETALALIDGVGARTRPLRIADLGTGTGALLLALTSELPDAFGIGTDLSVSALKVARENALRTGLAARTAFVACNFGAALSSGFDLVVSNPPYIASGEIVSLAPEVRRDPRLALDGGADALDCYRVIASEALRWLAPGGTLVVELGAGQEAAVAELFRQAGLATSAARCDLAGIPRALVGIAPPH